MEILLEIFDKCNSIKMYGKKGSYFAEVYSLKGEKFRSFEDWAYIENMLSDVLEWLNYVDENHGE